MRLIDNLDEKLESVVRALREEHGPGGEFSTDDVTHAFASAFPNDEAFMDRRAADRERAHSLRGYLGGMFSGFVEESGTRVGVQKLQPDHYKLC